MLQDIINEAAKRLGLSVKHGIYRGKQGENNCDGIWWSDNWTFIVEVKTTDAYSIKLDKIAKYLENEIGTQGHNASCLIVVGRQDTATLEDQLRGSKHNWRMRIVGVDALFSAIELRELTEDRSLANKIIDLFMPQEFTRVDKIISTAFDFAIDQEEAGYRPNENTEGDDTQESLEKDKRTVSTNLDLIEEFRVKISEKMASKFNTHFDRNRSLFASSAIRFSVAVSKQYKRRDKYWYAYHPRQKDFLSETQQAYFKLGCLDEQKAFAIPFDKMNQIASEMLTTSPKGNENKKYHHVVIREDNGRYCIFAHPTKSEMNINDYEI